MSQANFLRALLLILSIICPVYCWAGTTPPVDIGALVLLAGFYVLGLVAFIIGGWWSKNIRILLGLYIVIPIAWIVGYASLEKSRNGKILAESETGKKANEEAFSRYCKNRKKTVISRIKPRDGLTIFTRFESKFYGDKSKFNTGYVFASHPFLCDATRVAYFEGVYDGKYSPEKKGYEQEIRRYKECKSSEWSVVPDIQSKYEVILGEEGEIARIPWSAGGNRMSSSSVRIADRLTGETLAEDTVYFLWYGSGEAGCQEGTQQLAELIAEVFSGQ